MKKTIKSLLAIAIAAFAFTACSDVPEPYQIPGKGGGGDKGSEIYTSANLKTGWTLKAVTADQPWSQGSSYVQATGYQKWDGADTKSNRAVEGWLISPAINTEGYENVKFSFDNTIKYTNNVTGWEAYHKVYVSDNYTNDVSTATWVALDFTPVSSPYSDWTLYTSGEIQLPASMVGKSAIHFAFWFKAPANASTTWELMNFKVEEGIANNEPEPEPTPAGNHGTAEAPLTVAQAIALIDAESTISEAYVKGKISKVDSYNATYKSITYWISDDGTTTTQLQVYSGKGLNGADFAAQTDLAVGQTVVVKGALKKYNDTYEFDKTSSIISIDGEGGGGGDTPTPTPTGENLLVNGDFETWTGDTPNNWDGVTKNATIEKTTNKHNGEFALLVKGASQNKRVAYKEIKLKKGTYVLSCYAKAATEAVASVRPGYAKLTNGAVADSQNDYKYGNYTNDITNTEWKVVTHSFTLEEETSLNIILMNPKSTNSDVIIDDVTLTTSDGGIVDGEGSGGGDTPTAGSNHGTAAAPLTVAQAIALIDAESTISEAYVKGKISQIDSYNATYKSITYWISDDGTTTTQLQVYSGKGLNGADFSAKEDLTVGKAVVIKGALKKYNSTYEFDKTSSILSIE